MLGRIKKKIIISIGESNKSNFKKCLPQILSSIPANHSGLHVISMSGKKYFEDQLLSLLSFYYNAGTPKSWTIYNDGTYTKEEIGFFNEIESVAVKNIIIDEEFKTLTAKFPTFKKISFLKTAALIVQPYLLILMYCFTVLFKMHCNPL